MTVNAAPKLAISYLSWRTYFADCGVGTLDSAKTPAQVETALSAFLRARIDLSENPGCISGKKIGDANVTGKGEIITSMAQVIRGLDNDRNG